MIEIQTSNEPEIIENHEKNEIFYENKQEIVEESQEKIESL